MSNIKKQSMSKVETFLQGYTNKNTKNSYRDGLIDFFGVVYGAPGKLKGDKAKVEWLNVRGNRYLGGKQDFEKDIIAFIVALNGRAPKGIRLRLTAVKMFLMENDIEFPQKFWKKVQRRIKGNRALTLDKVPSNKELRRIVMHLPIHGKALFLLLSSSGMRIGEALKLNLENVKLNETPMQIEIPGEYTKTGNSRYAFASRETKEIIQEWLKNREKYIKSAVRKSHMFKKTTVEKEDRLFPFESQVAYVMWRNALDKARLNERDKSTNIRKLHPHVLRKFFRTRLGAVIQIDVIEALMGHEGYLTEVYRRYSMEDLAKFYLQGEAALLIFTEAEEVIKLRKEVEESKSELQSMVNHLQMKSIRLEEENIDLKNQQRKTEDELDKIIARLEKQDSELGELKKLIRERTSG